MGKAARRKHPPDHTAPVAGQRGGPSRPRPAPYVARPFAGLAGETDWVALTEILSAATAEVSLKEAPTASQVVTVATVLPMAWAALRRADGAVLIATQHGGGSGDASRDLGSALRAALDAKPGTPLPHVALATEDSPRLQDLLDVTVAPDVTVHPGFDFWVEGQDLDGEARESLQRANDSVAPTTPMQSARSAYWCLIGKRSHLRLVLPQDEDLATNALARLHAAGSASLGAGTRLLGAFRTCGLLCPVWELVGDTGAEVYEAPLGAFTVRYAEAAADESPLTHEQRRSRAGLLSRQVTLR